ncbi:MAG TPA: hypothetical protein VNL71_24320 [Chloroflexota bacterium]|nr:hypothetical protein [Chloroflexota bacterium]
MKSLETRLERLEARSLVQGSLPGLTVVESAALMQRVHTAVGQAWEDMTEQERQEAENLSQTELAQRLEELRTLLVEQAKAGISADHTGQRGRGL